MVRKNPELLSFNISYTSSSPTSIALEQTTTTKTQQRALTRDHDKKLDKRERGRERGPRARNIPRDRALKSH